VVVDRGKRRAATFHFCPPCGSTVWWEAAPPAFVTVAIGACADPDFPPPHVSLYEERRHPWVFALGQLLFESEF
jgi:hypothetical protein